MLLILAMYIESFLVLYTLTNAQILGYFTFPLQSTIIFLVHHRSKSDSKVKNHSDLGILCKNFRVLVCFVNGKFLSLHLGESACSRSNSDFYIVSQLQK